MQIVRWVDSDRVSLEGYLCAVGNSYRADIITSVADNNITNTSLNSFTKRERNVAAHGNTDCIICRTEVRNGWNNTICK